MGFYRNRVLPRCTDILLGTAMDPIRARVCDGLSGEVLELGFGSGRNLPHVPAGVTRVLAVEPASGGPRLAAPRIAAAGVPVELIGEDGQAVPLPDCSVDHVLVTWTLCSIPAPDRALAEVRRVLRPGGTLHFVEHGRSPRPGPARWQDRLTPAWRRVFGGCHLNRPIDELVGGSGLALERVDTYVAAVSGRDGPPLPRPVLAVAELSGFFYEGVARKPV